MADGIVQRYIVEQMKAGLAQIADAVSGADPDLTADVFNALHIGQGRDIPDVHILKILFQRAVKNFGALCAEVQLAGLLGIGEKADRTLDAAVLAAEPENDLLVFECEYIARLGYSVDESVRPEADITDVDVFKSGIVQGFQRHIQVDDGDARSACNIHQAVFILGDGADAGRLQPVPFVPHRKLAALHHGRAVGVGADPQPVMAVNKKAGHTGDAVGGIHALEAVAVVSDQTGVAADPDEALAGFRNGIGLGGGQTVRVVVQDGGKTFALPGRIDGEGPVDVAACVESLCRTFSRGGSGCRKQHAENQQYTEEQRGGPAGPTVNIRRIFHVLSFLSRKSHTIANAAVRCPRVFACFYQHTYFIII